MREITIGLDYYRSRSRGLYDTDFSFLSSPGSIFPSLEVKDRNSMYRFRMKEYNGLYNRNKKLIAMVNGVSKYIDYQTISVNYFKVLTNKMTDIVFNQEVSIKSGDIKKDKEIQALVNRVNWTDAIREAFKLSTIYGDSCIKTSKNGASAFAPLNCIKIINEHDKSDVLGYVCYEYIYAKDNNSRHLTHIRFEIHFKGCVFEQAWLCEGDYTGVKLVRPTRLNYRGRVIPPQGTYYDTGVDDCELVQWLTISKESDGVYGESLYVDIQDVVFAMEQRISSEYHSLNGLQNPFLIIGASATQQDAKTGERELKLVNNSVLIQKEGSDGVKPEFITPDYKLDNSEKLVDTFRDLLYELSEMSKCYLSGQYSGNPSEESINNLIKSALDKGNRLLTEQYSSIRDSLYVLCRLNGIDVKKEDLTLNFNIGRTDDDEKVTNIATTLINNKILSKATVREKYFGYNAEQSEAEEMQIQKEAGSADLHFNNKDIPENKVVESVVETQVPENKEEITNGTK